VLRGYTFGLAIVIALKQLPHLGGWPDLRGDFVPLLVAELVRTSNQVHIITLCAGLIALALLFLCERVRRLPGSLLVIALGVIASGWLSAHNRRAVSGCRAWNWRLRCC
jgi:MFS superfamily sulfate permease-like transporter